MAFALLECARTAIDVASRRAVHALTDEHLAVGEQHCLGRGERLQDAAYLLPSRPRLREIDALDRPRLSAALILPRNHEPLVRHRMPVTVDLNKARGGAAVGPDLRRGVEERPVVFRGDVAVRILQRREHVQAPSRSLRELGGASSDAEPGATGHALVAIIHLDRKSTRLNSSHSQISYAVFCLKKKKKSR